MGNHRRETIGIKRARERLGLIWIIGFAFLFFIFLIQTLAGRYEGVVDEAWGWWLPLVLPSITLIISSYAAEAVVSKGKKQKAKGKS